MHVCAHTHTSTHPHIPLSDSIHIQIMIIQQRLWFLRKHLEKKKKKKNVQICDDVFSFIYKHTLLISHQKSMCWVVFLVTLTYLYWFIYSLHLGPKITICEAADRFRKDDRTPILLSTHLHKKNKIKRSARWMNVKPWSYYHHILTKLINEPHTELYLWS